MSNFINVDKAYYAILTKDDSTGATYNAPKSLGPAVKISVDAATSRSPFYADGLVQEYAQVLGEIKVSLELSTLSLSTQAELLGHSLDGAGGIWYSKDDIAPYVAILYRRKKANGKFRYVKLLKCLFGEPKAEAETQTASVKVQTDSLEGVAMPRTFDGDWRYSVDDEEINYVDISSTFFSSVGIVDTTLPTITSSTPALNATAVAVGTNYQLVFSEGLAPGCVNSSNFYLVKDTDGTIVTSNVAWNGTTKTVTVTPTAALTAATKYLLIVGANVVDLAGNKCAQGARIFTTA